MFRKGSEKFDYQAIWLLGVWKFLERKIFERNLFIFKLLLQVDRLIVYYV